MWSYAIAGQTYAPLCKIVVICSAGPMWPGLSRSCLVWFGMVCTHLVWPVVYFVHCTNLQFTLRQISNWILNIELLYYCLQSNETKERRWVWGYNTKICIIILYCIVVLTLDLFDWQKISRGSRMFIYLWLTATISPSAATNRFLVLELRPAFSLSLFVSCSVKGPGY